MFNKMKIAYAVLAGIIALVGIGLQFYVSVPAYLSQGHSVLWSVVELLSYFTILTNLLVTVTYLSLLIPNTSAGKFFARVELITGIAVYITIVGFIYELVLRKLWHPEGLLKTADTILHNVTPILFVAFWLIFVPKQNLKWKLAFNWLLYPFVYLIYIIIRGEIMNRYPYGFIDINIIGYQQAAINSLLVLLAFVSFGLMFISVSRLFSKPTDS